MIFSDWLVVAFIAINALIYVLQVGQPREPITTRQAIYEAVAASLMILNLLLSHLR